METTKPRLFQNKWPVLRDLPPGPDTFDYRTYDEEFRTGEKVAANSNRVVDLNAAREAGRHMARANVTIETVHNGPNNVVSGTPKALSEMFGVPIKEWDEMTQAQKDDAFTAWNARERGPRPSILNVGPDTALPQVNGMLYEDWRKLSNAEKTAHAAAYMTKQTLAAHKDGSKQQLLLPAPLATTVPPVPEPEAEPRRFSREILDAKAEAFVTELVDENKLENMSAADFVGYLFSAIELDRLIAEVQRPGAGSGRITIGYSEKDVQAMKTQISQLQLGRVHAARIEQEHAELVQLAKDNFLMEKCNAGRWQLTWGACTECGATEPSTECKGKAKTNATV